MCSAFAIITTIYYITYGHTFLARKTENNVRINIRALISVLSAVAMGVVLLYTSSHKTPGTPRKAPSADAGNSVLYIGPLGEPGAVEPQKADGAVLPQMSEE
jgi:cytochrome bd-type quinol oxidase subunit 2